MSNDLDFAYDKDFFKDYGIYVKPINYPLSERKIESLLEIAKMQKYFQCNPVQWIDIMYNIELIDSQALVVQRSWIVPHFLAVCTRGWGKSTVIDLELMAKDSLFTNIWSYIASGTGDQAQQTFTTLEKLANDNIDTFEGSTGKIFKDEVVIKAASGDGFSHNPSGFEFQLYNGSSCKTLNSNVDNKRGGRGSVIFDESGFLSAEMMKVYSAFAIVEKGFKTGKVDGHSIDPIRQRTFATDIPNQLFYISSASSTDTPFYQLYKEYSKRMIMGDPDYYVVHIDCEQAFKPTLRGELIAPLLSRSTVAAEMRTNPEKARREYYCQFTTDAGNDAIVKRGVIIRNEEPRPPVLSGDGKHKYIICYDPARQRDNSFILVGEVYEEKASDGSKDIKARLVNGINLLDVGKKIKSPMQTPDQVKYLKQVILDYNAGADNYDNIVGVYIDAGAGGGGVSIADYLMADWEDDKGNIHPGLIDKEFSEDYVSKFPNAINKLHLMAPSKWKSQMFESMIEMVNQDKMKFTASYDHKGYITTFDVDEELLKKEKRRISEKLKAEQKLEGEELAEAVKEELKKADTIQTKMVKLSWYEELALSNIDAMKEELCNMARKKHDSGKDSFDLIPEKANTLHDDRAYCASMLGFALHELRRKEIIGRPKQSNDELLRKLASSMRASSIIQK
jgi:hypothetical protein